MQTTTWYILGARADMKRSGWIQGIFWKWCQLERQPMSKGKG